MIMVPKGTLNYMVLVTHWSLVAICCDACRLSCVSAEACFTSWPNAQDHRDGEVS